MRYLIAILHTILLVLVPMIIIPVLQWYKREFCESGTELFLIYYILIIITTGSFYLTMAMIYNFTLK